jgi:DNA-binding FadR family transcriptional regulator
LQSNPQRAAQWFGAVPNADLSRKRCLIEPIVAASQVASPFVKPIGSEMVRNQCQKLPAGDTKRQPRSHIDFAVLSYAPRNVGPTGLVPEVSGAAIGSKRALENWRNYGILRTMQTFDQTLTRLKALIADDGIQIGDRIPPERALATELGVGRRSLRRALDVLEREGHISRRQGRGTFIHGKHGGATGMNGGPLTSQFSEVALDQILEHTNPIEVLEIRLAIEPTMARLAALRASQSDMRKLKRLGDETRDAKQSAAYEQADADFHRAVAEASRNGLFLALFDMLSRSQRDASWQHLGENGRCYKRQSVHAACHQDIVDAIAARDGLRAQDAMYRHLSDVQMHLYQHAFPAATRS